MNKIWSLARIGLGLVFFWAFIDKVWGLGYATKAGSAWLDGVSPTTGFLSHSTGPWAEFFQNLAGSAWVDWLFMLGLLLIGIALILGIGLKLAGWFGALLMLLMWTSLLPVENNPLLDEHIIYALVLIGFAITDVGHDWSFASRWRNSRLVGQLPFLA